MGKRDTTDGEEEFLIPLAFDPSTEGHPSSRPQSQTTQDPTREDIGTVISETSRDDRDYPQDAVSRGSSEHPSPHIAYQEKGWQREMEARRDMEAAVAPKYKASPQPADSAKFEKAGSTRSSTDLPISSRDTSALSGPSHKPSESQSLDNAARRLHDHESADSSRSPPSSAMAQLPKRGDSLETKLNKIPRKEIGTSPKLASTLSHGESLRLRSESAADQPKQRNTTSASSTPQLDSQRPQDRAGSPALLRNNNAGDLPADDDLALAAQTSESFLRRMSNSVRHGRSFSDKSMRVKDAKSPRSPANGSIVGTDISSPTADKSDEIIWLRSELRKERQRISEMENALRGQEDVKQVNTELSEKRSTMVVLDAQREMVLRELTVLTDHLEAEKRGTSDGPLDLGKLSNNILRELAESIKKLKESYTPQIEDLIQQRNDLSEELANMNRQKEKSMQEFEQLSSKNAQLAELNNQLVHQIQELYRSHSDQRGSNGLGIHSYNKEKGIEALRPAINDLLPSVSTTHISEEAEPTTATATVVPGPQVVSIRKGQPRKFNWKKGSQNVAKGVKGLKGAFMSSESVEGAGGMPRSQTQDPTRQGFGFFGNQKHKQGGKIPQTESVPVLAEPPSTGMFPAHSCPCVPADLSAGLFGTNLEARMEHEKSIIPAIVTRCIQEVELRGLFFPSCYFGVPTPNLRQAWIWKASTASLGPLQPFRASATGSNGRHRIMTFQIRTSTSTR